MRKLILYVCIILLGFSLPGLSQSIQPAQADIPVEVRARIQYDEYEVGGMILSSPTPDSTGNYHIIALPPGSRLSVPKPDTLDTRPRNRA